jgi:hypothetical protein
MIDKLALWGRARKVSILWVSGSFSVGTVAVLSRFVLVLGVSAKDISYPSSFYGRSVAEIASGGTTASLPPPSENAVTRE